MALNITFDGFAFDKDANLGNSDIYYQGFFYKNSTSSSDSKWNTVRTVEATGYYSINLGDADWLSQDGNALSGAKVILVFWRGSDSRIADCNALQEWGALELDLDGSVFYTQDIQIKDNIAPNALWSHNAGTFGLVGNTYNFSNNSDDRHTWEFVGPISGSTVEMNHWPFRYGQDINPLNSIVNTLYEWGDGNDTNVDADGDSTYSWTTSGDFEVSVTVEDACGETSTHSDTVQIKWAAPTGDIEMLPASPAPNEPVSFVWVGEDPNDSIIDIKWVIKDSGKFGNTDTDVTVTKDVTVPHVNGVGTDWCGEQALSGAFTNPGQHEVTIEIRWDDGFDTQVVNYSETFPQRYFSPPIMSFEQLPIKASLGEAVTFTNTSTRTNRVGTGLPDCVNYMWNWSDSGNQSSETDVDYDYVFSRTPETTECNVRLCASWSDGWETKSTCVEQAVVFDTTITVVPDDCYYNMNIIGTSSDGSISSYSWTVSSGTTENGPWSEVWQSPNDLNQQNKNICFTSAGWYKIEGFVHGNGTSTTDNEVMFINEVCPASSAVYNIWNGTGELDTGSDWLHTGIGQESTIAKYRGTNGLLVSCQHTSKVEFHRSNYSDMDVNDYDFLSFWMNIQNWQKGKDVDVKLFSPKYVGGSSVKLSAYINENKYNTWVRVMIPLEHFKLKHVNTLPGWPTMISAVRLTFNGKFEVYMDNVSLTMGSTVTVPVGVPDMSTSDVGNKTMRINPNLAPSMKTLNPYPNPRNR